MKIFFSEYQPDYAKYHFPYQVYAIRQQNDKIDSIYKSGFLPTRIDKDLFYLARSLRIDLKNFTLSSENRRILKKNPSLTLETIESNKFDYDFNIGKIGSDFYKRRGEVKGMSAQKIKSLIVDGYLSHLLRFSIEKKVVGYCLVNISESFMHYAYPFYVEEYEKKNLGMGMILNAINHSISLGHRYFYLGTVYSKSSLYKTQFSGVQFFDGMGWSSDIGVLKNKIDTHWEGHLFEKAEDKRSLISRIK